MRKYFKRKKCKNSKKRKHAFKDFSTTYNVKILNSFKPELQLKGNEFTIKSKLIELLTQSKGFKFVATLVLVFKKIESEDKTKFNNFYSSSKAEVIIKVTLMMCFKQSLLQI